MKKNRLFVCLALLGIPFFALGQYGTRDDGFGNRIPLGPPNTQPQQRPVLQPYYPRTNVVPSPRPSQTSISPTQPPTIGTVGRKPILYSGPGCGICQQMMADFRRNNPGKDINDYFEVIDDRSKFQPSIEGGPIGKEGVVSAIAGAVAAGPVRTAPIPTDPQPLELKKDAKGYYFADPDGDAVARLPGYKPNEKYLTRKSDGKAFSLEEAAKESESGKLLFKGKYDPATGKLLPGEITFAFKDAPPVFIDPAKVPVQKFVPPPGFSIKPPAPVDPTTMTNEELKAQMDALQKGIQEEQRKKREREKK